MKCCKFFLKCTAHENISKADSWNTLASRIWSQCSLSTPLKAVENLRCSAVFRACRNKTLAWNASVIRQKGESQNGCFKKTKYAKFSEKQTVLTPWYAHILKQTCSWTLSVVRMCAYQGVRNVRFSENLACFVFLKHPFWDSPFCLITDEVGHSIECILSGQQRHHKGTSIWIETIA